MDQVRIETIAAGGALIISAGSFWYLNSKLDEGLNRLDVMQKHFMIQIAKMSQHDDDIKIVGSKIKDFEKIIEDMNKLREDLSTMANEVSDEFQKMKKDISKQEKNMENLNSKLDKIFEHLGIQQEITPTKVSILKKKKGLSIKPKVGKTEVIQNRKNIKDQKDQKDQKEQSEENVFNEMNNILSS